MIKKILVVNGGSSSLKFQILEEETKKILSSGIAERIKVDGSFTIKIGKEKFTTEKTLNNHTEAIQLLISKLNEHKVVESLDEIIGIGHRIVQGGEIFKKATLIDEKQLVKVRELGELAPLHNPGEADIIEAFFELLPGVPNVGVFDTSFHQTMPKEAYLYAVPNYWYTKHMVRRYGAHGTSHKYITQRMQKHLEKENVNLVICHLGNGSSLSAIKNSKVINTSMGLSPLAGLIMGTRSGDIDPTIVNYICNRLNKSSQEVTDMLNNESGLLALSGISSDMRDINQHAKNGDERAQFTMRSFAKRVATYIVDYANQINAKLDGIIFTAGIGENSSEIQKAIVKELFLIDTKLSSERIKADYSDLKLISEDDANTPVYAVRTNEEMLIVKELLNIIKK